MEDLKSLIYNYITNEGDIPKTATHIAEHLKIPLMDVRDVLRKLEAEGKATYNISNMGWKLKT